MANKKLEYVLSGTSYLDIGSSEPHMLESYDRMVKHIEDTTAHKFSILYNAFTEKSHGPHLNQFKELNQIYADSGGLQIITRGMSITEQLKDEVYENQAAYSHMGMCFDDIPVNVVGGSSKRNDTANRIYGIELLEPAARATGRNLARQIEVFLKAETTCKPILIAQGNCYDSYMKWVELVMQEVPRDMHPCIGGVAMGGAALGTGPLEDIQRAFYFTQLPMDQKQHLHVLGVGTPTRMLPYLAFIKNGLYDGVTVSYDSTSHSNGLVFGTYYVDALKRKFHQHMNPMYNRMHTESGLFHDKEVSLTEFHKILNTAKGAYREGGGNVELFSVIRNSVIMSSVKNFCLMVDDLLASDQAFLEYVGARRGRNLHHMLSLSGVRDLESFNHWYRHVGKYVESNRVGDSQSGSYDLGDLID